MCIVTDGERTTLSPDKRTNVASENAGTSRVCVVNAGRGAERSTAEGRVNILEASPLEPLELGVAALFAIGLDSSDLGFSSFGSTGFGSRAVVSAGGALEMADIGLPDGMRFEAESRERTGGHGLPPEAKSVDPVVVTCAGACCDTVPAADEFKDAESVVSRASSCDGVPRFRAGAV